MENRIQKLEQILKNDRFAHHNEIRLVSIGIGTAIAEMSVGEKHLNGVDILDQEGTKIAYFTGAAFLKGEF